MPYTFDMIEARDPSNPEMIAANALVTIFAPGDETQTPLNITTTQGWPMANPIQVNAMGYGPAFMHETLGRVAWSGGEFTGFFTAHDSIKQEAVAAAASAEASRAAAIAAASAAEEAARRATLPADDAVDEGIARANIPGIITKAVSGKLDKDDADAIYATRVDGRLVANLESGDATAELQALLDALDANGGGTLEIPDNGREIEITRTLRHGGNTRIIGQSKGTRIGAIGDFTLLASKTPATRIDNVEIADIEIRRYGSVSSTPIIDWTGVSHSTMRGVKVEQGTAKSGSVGILLGLNSYYNNFTGVQVRNVNEGFKLQDAANGNRFNGGTVVLYSTHGFVVDNCNANAFMGASVEILTGTGFLLRNGSKMNQIIGCRVEDVKLGVHVVWSGATSAFNNVIIGNAYYMGPGQSEILNETDNVVIDSRMGHVFKNLQAADLRTFITAYKSTAQTSLSAGTWTKVLYQGVDADNLSELSNSTMTAKTAGFYSVDAAATFVAITATATIQLGVYKNGALWRILDKETSIANEPTMLSGSTQLPMAVGDTLEIWATTTSAVGISSGRAFTSLQVSRAG